MALDQKEILKFIRSSSKPVTKREVARAFGIKGGENRVALKQILKKLENQDAYIAFKEVMRVLRKMKYN